VCVNNNYKDGLELNGTHQLLAYADDNNDNNVMGKNINNMKKNRDALSDASEEDRVHVNTGKYMFMSSHYTAGQYCIKLANKSLEM
jgi:hypothetical protein